MFNLNLTNDVIENYDQTVADLKKPTIPNGSLLELMYIGMDYGKKAKERAKESGRENSPKDGFTLEYIVTGYYKKDKKFVQTIDFTDPDDVKFLVPGLTLKTYYFLNTSALKFAGYLEPKDDNECTILYRQLMERDLSISHKSEIKEGMVIHAFRVMEQYYPLSEYIDPKAKPRVLKSDAKKSTKSYLTTAIPVIEYNEDGSVKKIEVSKEKIEQKIKYIDDATVEKIYKAIITNETVDKGEAEDSPF